MGKYLDSFFKDESGVETIEYLALAMVAGLLAVVIAKFGTSLKEKTQSKMDEAVAQLDQIGQGQ